VADYQCRQGLLSLVNQSFDTQIGAVGIATLMEQYEIRDILKNVTGVRSGNAIAFGVG